MKKKLVALMLTLTTATLLFAACGGDTTPTPESGDVAEAAPTTEEPTEPEASPAPDESQGEEEGEYVYVNDGNYTLEDYKNMALNGCAYVKIIAEDATCVMINNSDGSVGVHIYNGPESMDIDMSADQTICISNSDEVYMLTGNCSADVLQEWSDSVQALSGTVGDLSSYIDDMDMESVSETDLVNPTVTAGEDGIIVYQFTYHDAFYSIEVFADDNTCKSMTVDNLGNGLSLFVDVYDVNNDVEATAEADDSIMKDSIATLNNMQSLFESYMQ